MSGGRQWNLGDAGIPTRVTYPIEVTANGLLSILPGTTLTRIHDQAKQRLASQ